MRPIIENLLWIGNAGDLSDPALPERCGIRAIVHLAMEEKIPLLSREITYCRFPLMDGAGNPIGLLTAAMTSTATLIKQKVSTLVCCSAGMSRSPCVVAGALALARQKSPKDCLDAVIRDAPHDLSPQLWEAVVEAVDSRGWSLG